MKHGPTWNVGTPCLLFLRLAWFWLNLFWLAFTLLAYMWTDFVDSMLPHFLSTPLFWLNSFWLRSFCSLNLLTHFATPLCRLTLFLRRILRIRHFVLTQFVLTRSLCWLTLLTHFVDPLCYPYLLTHFVDSLCWPTLLPLFVDALCLGSLYFGSCSFPTSDQSWVTWVVSYSSPQGKHVLLQCRSHRFTYQMPVETRVSVYLLYVCDKPVLKHACGPTGAWCAPEVHYGGIVNVKSGKRWNIKYYQ